MQPEQLSDDTTLEQAALLVVEMESGQALASITKTKLITVQFWRLDHGKRELMPYTETVGTFRSLAKRRLAVMEISDGRGGLKAGAPSPELVD